MMLTVDEVASGVHHARAKHTSWVLLTEGTDVTLVDAGYPGDRERVVESLNRIGRRVSDVAAVLLTHAHPDHIGSCESLRTEQGVPVHAHRAEAAHARGEVVEQVAVADLLRQVWRPEVLRWLSDVIALRGAAAQRIGEVATFDEGRLDVPGAPVAILTPGHTSGHACFHLPERGALLAGDALMTGHALVTEPGPRMLPDLFQHDPEAARRSLHRLRELPADVVVPGHGGAFAGTPREAVLRALQPSGQQGA